MILSMFPASYQTVGYIPAGTQTSDPADDPQLLAETESHYWFQFDTGSGMINADPLMAGAAQSGRPSRPPTGTFTAVPQSLEQTTEVQLVAEIYTQLGALFGQSGLQDTTVLDQTFDDVELVGRPLTVGNFVSQSGLSAIFTEATNTYTPYLVIGDDALPDSQLPDAITGTPYQEVLTNFPLASQILTGLFLNVTLSGPGTASETFTQTLVDRFGYAARQGMAPPESLSVNPSGPPIITPFDLTTLNILPGLQSPDAAQLLRERGNEEVASILSEASPTAVDQTDALIAVARSELADFAVASDQETASLEIGASVTAYSDVPRITTFSSQLVTTGGQSSISYSIDLLNDLLLAVPSPGQNVEAALTFAGARGLVDSSLETQILPSTPGSQNLGAATIIQQSVQDGIPLAVVNASDLSLLQALSLPADAIARITTNVQNGLTVFVPTRALTVDGAQTTAWLNYDPTTGELIAESQSGGYQELEEEAEIQAQPGTIQYLRQLQGSYLLPPNFEAAGYYLKSVFFGTLQGIELARIIASLQSGNIPQAIGEVVVLILEVALAFAVADPPVTPSLSGLGEPAPLAQGTPPSRLRLWQQTFLRASLRARSGPPR